MFFPIALISEEFKIELEESYFTQEDPSKLNTLDKEIYDLLKTWNYPNSNIDLYKILEKAILEINDDIELFAEKQKSDTRGR